MDRYLRLSCVLAPCLLLFGGLSETELNRHVPRSSRPPEERHLYGVLEYLFVCYLQQQSRHLSVTASYPDLGCLYACSVV